MGANKRKKKHRVNATTRRLIKIADMLSSPRFSQQHYRRVPRLRVLRVWIPTLINTQCARLACTTDAS